MRRALCVLTAVAAVMAGLRALAQPQHGLEREVKAAVLAKLVKFVDWPEGALGDPGSPFPICVVGNTPFAAILERTVSGDSVQGHPLSVQRIAGIAGVESCRVVFVPIEQEQRTMLAKLHGVLTVGETSQFVRAGGHIGLVIDGGNVRFDLNLKSAQASGLVVSSKVASIARFVIANHE
jgi:hypothetical protein